jgi:hypothetical protein
MKLRKGKKKKKDVHSIGKPRCETRAFEMEQPPPNVEVDTLRVATIKIRQHILFRRINMLMFS